MEYREIIEEDVTPQGLRFVWRRMRLFPRLTRFATPMHHELNVDFGVQMGYGLEFSWGPIWFHRKAQGTRRG